MWLIALVVVAVLILVSSPCDGTELSESVHTESAVPELQLAVPAGTEGTRIFPQRVNDDSVTYNVGDTSYVSLWDKLLYPLPNGESTEEQQGYNTYYNVPSTVNFHDIYSNSLALLAGDPVGPTVKDEDASLTTGKDDKSFHLNTINTNFVEFHPKLQTIPPVTLPPPMFLLNSSYIKTDSENKTTTSTTEEPEEANVEVIPIKKEKYQRGLLDLLFPAARVRTFKTVFDTFRRIMSHTFR